LENTKSLRRKSILDIVYKKYKPNNGFEALQTELYTEVTGLPIIPEDLRPYKRERNPETARYAFTRDGDFLAYVTSRLSRTFQGRNYISYPWAHPDCPHEVKDRIFSDLLEYLKGHKDTKEIATYILFASDNCQEQIEFFLRNNFTEKERLYFYNRDFNLQDTSSWSLSGELNSLQFESVNKDNLDQFITFCRKDRRTQHNFPTDDALRTFIETRILPTGHLFSVLKDDKIVAAGSVLNEKDEDIYQINPGERVMANIALVSPSYPAAWKRLIKDLAKKCIEYGWNRPLRVRIPFITESSTAIGLAEIQSEFIPLENFMIYQE